MKHNNQLPNAHFRKDWQRFVKTWFDQPVCWQRSSEQQRQWDGVGLQLVGAAVLSVVIE